MKKLIQICGDPTVDWFRIHNEEIIVRGGVYYWEKPKEDTKVRLSSKPGGSAMIYQLLSKMISKEIAEVQGASLEEELLNRPKDDRITTSWTVWKEFPNPGSSHNAFRLEKWHEFEPGSWDYAASKLNGYPDLLIIQDTNLGFRNCQEGWPEVLLADHGEKLPQDIIIQLGQYNDGKDNPILDRIMNLGWAVRTTVVTSISDLRACAVKIGISLSWERMLEEVVAAVLSKNCPFAESKAKGIKYKQVIVTLGASGAIIIGKSKSTMIFDRSWQEGEFANQYPGQVMGYHACLLGALASDWAENQEELDWIRASSKGVKLARKLHILGYEAVRKDNYKQLSFPYQSIAGFYQELSSKANRPDSMINEQIGDLGFFSMSNDTIINIAAGDHWTILEEKLLKNQQSCFSMQDPHNAVNECARNIVLKGPLTALPDVPVEKIGAWFSADRQEIEGVRSVKNAMRDYLRLKNPETPLCVAVFGPPGAGKSFVVKEIAKGLGIGENAQLTFNLSQFESPQELLTAFHQIRDLNLQGEIPLVFWDEFDNPCEGRNLGWLRYFLAPMQDGEFSDHGIARPLGGGIYVFAGATRHSFTDFQRADNPQDRTAKKPDFISRLSAYINIRGINGNPNTVEDRLYMIRRAFILRQYLETNAPQIRTDEQFVIETGVLDAFLRVNKYYHGARSMENLIKMSSLADKRKFELSSLPPDNIIGMHVNVKEFNALTIMGDRKTLSIGITGHTKLDPQQTGKLEKAINEAICYIEQQFAEHYLTIYSTLAAGAERLVARQLLNREAARLIAILPLPQKDYLNEFAAADDYRLDSQGAELRKELEYWLSHKAIEIIEMPASSTRKSAYLKAGYYIAEHSDVLIAIWDGNELEENSITVQIIDKAGKLNKAICHIWADNFKLDPINTKSKGK
ncbi:MAG: ATP-binding protein, partial [Syntrophomonadaceae bacterium]|nr:ATP-binding protein [Syntrophomonadaceae bacterium]